MTEKPIFNTVNSLKYVLDEDITKSTYDEENSTIRMCKKDWEKFKKELGMND